MGDALLPVERPMIEDKAGWGLVPGLQALLLHIHTTAAAQWAAPTTAGLGWAGCTGARLHSAEESHSPRTSLGSQGKGNAFRVAPC